jgi:telomerase reverse transcriptase
MSATEAARIAEEAAAAHTSPDAVCAFLRHALLRVVPGEFWGSKRNLRVLCDNVRRLVTLRRHETLSVAQLLHGFKLGDCAWLLPCGGARRGPLSRAQRHGATQRLACWLEWLFEQLLIPLLRASFYCTDSEPLLNRVLFYRRPLWEVLQRTALDELRRAQFQELGPEEVRALAERGRRTLGVGLLRLRPRVIGLRPIVNLSRKVDRARILAAATAAAAVGAGCSRPPAAPPCVAGGAALSRLDSDLGVGGLEDDDAPARGSRFPAVNEALRPVFEVLKFERERRPALLGASVFGHGDIFAALREFSARVRGQKSESATEPLVFAVAVDVRKCFDTIDRARLLELVEEALREPHYFTQKLSVVYPKLDQVRTRFKFLAGLPGDMPLFFEEAARRAERTDSAVLSDHVFRQVHSRETLLARLRRHLSDSVVRIQDSFLRQAVGVPQGSVVSAFLACLYLAAVERAHILPALNRAAAAEAAELPTASPSSSPSTQPPRLLLRHMDDFLLLTQSRAEAEAFVAAMHRGFADLGVAVNPAKTKTNFAPQPSDAAPQLLPPARLVPWNGLVLDTDTVEVRADYARYGRAELRDSMTVESHTHPGEGLARALRRFLQHRCQPLLLDGRLNSPRTVALNVFQLTLLAGLKLVAYADGLRQLRADALRNQRFLAATVLDAIEYAWAVAATRVRLVSAELRRRRVSSPECALPLSRAEFHWLGFQALLLALSRRRASLPLVAAALADAAARAAREAGDSAPVSAKLLRELAAESAALLELGARTRGAAGGGSGVALR